MRRSLALAVLTLLVVSAAATAERRPASRTARSTPPVVVRPLVAYQAVGNWARLEALSDTAPATSAQADTTTAPLMLLMNEEQVLKGIEVRYEGTLRRVTFQVSQDALSWSVPPVQVKRDDRAKTIRLEFPPTVARAVMLKFEVDRAPIKVIDLSLDPVDRSRVDAFEIKVEHITENSAIVRWRTTLPSKSNLMYGFRPDRLRARSDPSYELRTEHAVELSGLLPGTDYFAWILLGLDRAAGLDDSKPLRFRTKGTAYPFAYALTVSSGKDTAAVSFRSNIPSVSSLTLRAQGTTEEREIRHAAPREALEHRIVATGLLPHTIYEYQAVTADSRGRIGATPWLTLATEAHNLAAGRPTLGTFDVLFDEQLTQDSRPALERLTDGRNDYFTGMATSGDPSETDQWAEVDLGAECSLQAIDVVWRGNAYSKQYFLLVSRDRVNWSYPGFNLDASGVTVERSTRGDPLRRVTVLIDAAERVRYIRVFVPRGSPYFTRTPVWRFVQIAEIEAHGTWSPSDAGTGSAHP